MGNVDVEKRIHLESIHRLSSIPVVESSVKYVGQLYGRIKYNNRLFNWYFDTAESTITAAYEALQPAVKVIELPLKRLDGVMCRSLNLLEERIPLVYLPPEMMYSNTKDYMADRFVKPVLKRADSVKQLGTAVLENPIATYAANRIDDAFTVGDKFVDKYLLPFDQDEVDAPSVGDNELDGSRQSEIGAIKAIHHGQRFSRKLKRRLTERTLAEARALQRTSKDSIIVVASLVHLVVTDPRVAFAKSKDLWLYLSQDELEHLATPASLERLVVFLTRETAKSVVHFVNFSSKFATDVPRSLSLAVTELYNFVLNANARLIELTRFDKLKHLTKEETELLLAKALTFYDAVQHLTNAYLHRLAHFLSGRIEAEKVTGSGDCTGTFRRRQAHHQTNNTVEGHNNVNGVY